MDDLISRQDAIDEVVAWLKDRMTDKKNGKPLTDRIRNLPPTQPEIIHCRECKHKGTKNCVANAWTTIFGVMVKDDFYCGLAERRIDE